jgi:hypothetical protein
MAKYDDFENVHSVVGLSGSVVGTTTSPALDTKGMEQCTVILQTGVITTTGTLDVKIEDSADNSVWADLTGAVFAQQVDANDNVLLVGKIKCNRDSGTPVRRYLRINGVVAVAGAEYGCLLIGSNLSGHIPYTTNALPAPTFNIGNP